MAQYARPDSDITTGDWTSVPLYAKVDEVAASDADFISATGDDYCEMGLSDIEAPGAGDVILRVRVRRPASSDDATLIVKLMEGSTVITERLVDVTSSSFVTASLTLTSGEKAAITDWSDLRVRLSRTLLDAVTWQSQVVTYGGSAITYA